MAVEFGLLGTIDVRLADRPADVGHMRQRCVLAALLVDVNRTVPVDALVDRVWGDRAPQRVRGTLYGYLSRLRQALEPAPEVVISRRPGGYVLEADPLSVDLHLFRDLVGRARTSDDTQAAALMRRAFGLWRGEPFATVDVPWFSDLRQAVERERFSAELDHVDVRLRTGLHGELLPELTLRAGEHPLDERLAGQLMLALYRTGRAADALACYQEVRLRLARELGADPGPRLRGLHQQILANDPALSLPEPSPRGTAAQGTTRSSARSLPAGGAPSPVPRQLPAPPVHFVGRDEQIAVLDKMLATQAGPRTAMPLSVICGTGGVGKTWLALRWAHSRRHRFPDGQLFADLRGFTPSGTPADPFTVIRGFLDTLGVDPGRIPAAPDAQAALYRSLLADRHLLVVLDNARDTEQILPLLPGTPTCTVVITSRDQLTGLAATHQVTHLTVDGFDSTTARELLVGRLGAERVAAEPDAAVTLVDQCAGLPLALSVLAARITTNPVSTLTLLAEELRERTSRLDALGTGASTTDVRTVLASSYRALDAETARVFRQLAQAPGPDISQSAAVSLTGLPPARARRALHRLRVAHLLQEHAPGRFGCHDLLRTYAIEVADSMDGAESRAARVRVIEHYLHTAWSADRLLHPHRDPIRLSPAADGVRPESPAPHDEAMTWFTQEHPALVAAVHQAARHGHETHAWQLAWALTTFLTRRGRWNDIATVHTTALAAAVRLGDAAAQAESHRALAWERIEAGDHDAAHRRLAQALSLARESGQVLSEAETHLALGWLHEHTGDRPAALRHDEHAVRLFTQLGHRAGLARALNAVAWDHVQQGDPRAAVTHCEQAMAIQGELDDLRGQAGTLDTLGYAHQQLGEHSEALACHRRSLELHRALGHRYNEAEALVHLGEVHRALGDRNAARRALEQAIDIYRDIEVHPSRLEQTLTLLAAVDTGANATR
ncbi:SARP family transcriptional regulator [Streptomyces fumigatiscleroticus]|nr:SARP family transcriptional regulator [Streptomyces fumigatiscleroticus]